MHKNASKCIIDDELRAAIAERRSENDRKLTALRWRQACESVGLQQAPRQQS